MERIVTMHLHVNTSRKILRTLADPDSASVPTEERIKRSPDLINGRFPVPDHSGQFPAEFRSPDKFKIRVSKPALRFAQYRLQDIRSCRRLL